MSIIHKCDECKKILDKKGEAVYGVSGIDAHYPKGDNTALLIMQKEKGYDKEEMRETKQSWTEYVDLSFCEPCWDKLPFKKYCDEE